jgi:hypothetical protein
MWHDIPEDESMKHAAYEIWVSHGDDFWHHSNLRCNSTVWSACNDVSITPLAEGTRIISLHFYCSPGQIFHCDALCTCTYAVFSMPGLFVWSVWGSRLLWNVKLSTTLCSYMSQRMVIFMLLIVCLWRSHMDVSSWFSEIQCVLHKMLNELKWTASMRENQWYIYDFGPLHKAYWWALLYQWGTWPLFIQL